MEYPLILERETEQDGARTDIVRDDIRAAENLIGTLDIGMMKLADLRFWDRLEEKFDAVKKSDAWNTAQSRCSAEIALSGDEVEKLLSQFENPPQGIQFVGVLFRGFKKALLVLKSKIDAGDFEESEAGADADADAKGPDDTEAEKVKARRAKTKEPKEG
jgi:hypothetical protein